MPGNSVLLPLLALCLLMQHTLGAANVSLVEAPTAAGSTSAVMLPLVSAVPATPPSPTGCSAVENKTPTTTVNAASSLGADQAPVLPADGNMAAAPPSSDGGSATAANVTKMAAMVESQQVHPSASSVGEWQVVFYNRLLSETPWQEMFS